MFKLGQRWQNVHPPSVSASSPPLVSTLLLLLILCLNSASERHLWIIHITVKSTRKNRREKRKRYLNRISTVFSTQPRGSNSLRPLLKVHSPMPASLSSGRKKNPQLLGQCKRQLSLHIPHWKHQCINTHSCPLTSGSDSKQYGQRTHPLKIKLIYERTPF